MSEAIHGLPAAPAAPKPKEAAAVVVWRRTNTGVEVFWLRREATQSFAGGFWAFPGGRVDAMDAQVRVDGAEGVEASHRVAAARELFEETGLLIADGAHRVSAADRVSARKDLLGKKVAFTELLSRFRLSIRAKDYLPAGRWITPAFMPLRYDARFFLAEAPMGSTAEIWPGEAAEGAWVVPQEALKRWQVGSALLHPPNLYALQVMADFRTPEDATQRLQNPLHCPVHVPTRIEFQRGIRVFPLETPTLPPAAHTNCYVLGNGELLIVDPGAAQVRQYARLLALIAGLKSEGRRPLAIFLTHHHADHVGGLEAVRERLGLPFWCHEWTAERLKKKPDRVFKDGDDLKLSGSPPMHFKVLHTPGHARGHLCLVEQTSKAAVVGDMVSGVSTIVIDPPEGDMSDYLQQLDRLRQLPVGALYPAHGPVMPDGPGKLTEYLRHRELREKKVLDAIGSGATRLPDIVARAYDDTPKQIHPIAERTAQAILIKLMRDGKIERREDGYARAAART